MYEDVTEVREFSLCGLRGAPTSGARFRLHRRGFMFQPGRSRVEMLPKGRPDR